MPNGRIRRRGGRSCREEQCVYAREGGAQAGGERAADAGDKGASGEVTERADAHDQQRVKAHYPTAHFGGNACLHLAGRGGRRLRGSGDVSLAFRLRG